jgi:hypothetical protein
MILASALACEIASPRGSLESQQTRRAFGGSWDVLYQLGVFRDLTGQLSMQGRVRQSLSKSQNAVVDTRETQITGTTGSVEYLHDQRLGIRNRKRGRVGLARNL